MAATYTNWTREIAEAKDKEDLSDIMARYSYSVGFAYSPNYGYRHHIDISEALHKHGIAQRFKEALHRERFLK